MISHSIVSILSRYPEVWTKYLLITLNFGPDEDKVKTPCRVQVKLKFKICFSFLLGANNIENNSSQSIVIITISTGSTFQKNIILFKL